jgi:malate dehydrogenase
VQAKAGAGSATTCMAYAGFRFVHHHTHVTMTDLRRFVNSILKALSGEKGITEETYLYLPGVPGGKEVAAELGVDYFAVPVELGPEGAVKAYPIGKLSAHEAGLLKIAVEELKGNVGKGVQFIVQ